MSKTFALMNSQWLLKLKKSSLFLTQIFMALEVVYDLFIRIFRI